MSRTVPRQPQPIATQRNGIAEVNFMTIQVEGVRYYSAAEVQAQLGVARQTLWRWRKEGKVPAGCRYRDHHVVFTRKEFDAIRGFANRIEPAENSAAFRSENRVRALRGGKR